MALGLCQAAYVGCAGTGLGRAWRQGSARWLPELGALGQLYIVLKGHHNGLVRPIGVVILDDGASVALEYIRIRISFLDGIKRPRYNIVTSGRHNRGLRIGTRVEAGLVESYVLRRCEMDLGLHISDVVGA